MGPRHADFFIERNGVLVGAGIHNDIFLPAGDLKRLADQRFADPPAGTGTDHAKIRDKQPICKIRDAEANAQQFVVRAPRGQADGGFPDQYADALLKAVPWGTGTPNQSASENRCIPPE